MTYKNALNWDLYIIDDQTFACCQTLYNMLNHFRKKLIIFEQTSLNLITVQNFQLFRNIIDNSRQFKNNLNFY